jgi:hypothetical protein
VDLWNERNEQNNNVTDIANSGIVQNFVALGIVTSHTNYGKYTIVSANIGTCTCTPLPSQGLHGLSQEDIYLLYTL